MPQRTRSHQLEDLSRIRLHSIFATAGWTVEDIRKDYGEDLLVRIFENQITTPLFFFVQARATDNISRYRSHEGSVRFPVERRHFQYWRDFWEPVIVSLWDSKTDRTYWNCFQSFLSTERGAQAIAEAGNTLKMPLDKVLDEHALPLIHAITKSRFERAEAEQVGAKALIELLREHLKLEIEYDPRQGVLVVTPPGEGPIFSFFGRTGEKLSEVGKHWGCSPEEAFNTAVKMLAELMEQGGPAVRKNLIHASFLLDQIGKIDGGDELLDMRSGRRKPATKPGPPNIEEVKRLLAGPRKGHRRSQKELPQLFKNDLSDH